MKKQPHITDATRSKLVAVFCELYQTRPIEKITVKEIVNKAGYNRTTFYQYFRDVHDARDYLEKDYVAYLTTIMISNIEKGLVLENFADTFAKMVSEREFQARVLLSNPANGHLIQRLRMEMIPTLLRAFPTPADDIRARYVLEFYLPGVVFAIGHWFQSGKDLPVNELGELIRSILEDGVLHQLNPSGR